MQKKDKSIKKINVLRKSVRSRTDFPENIYNNSFRLLSKIVETGT